VLRVSLAVMAMPASQLYAPIDLSGTCVLVTGATSGIGRAIAWRFAELGCKVAITGRRENLLEELKAELCDKFEKLPAPVCVKLDVSDLQQVQALPAKLAAAGMLEIDILVNNAGLALGVASTDENDLGDLQTMLNTNVLGVMALTRTFAPGMKSRGKGHLVNISSVAGHECYVGGSAYCATKHAINAFTIASRHDLAGTPIRVTAISPGMVETDFSKVRFGGDSDKAGKVYEGILPMHPEDIADQVIYVTTRPRHVQIADIISYATNQGHAKYVVERKGETMGAP
jgi:NADP-dependent 3-hydroxy acid dehydrogenase YdfG